MCPLRRQITRSALSSSTWTVAGRADFDPDLALLFRAKSGLKNQIPGNKNPFMSNVLGPQYVLQADGSYANAGAVAPVDVIGGRKMLRTCGSVTNLFSGDTSAARSVTLTAQKYTLHVFGAGSASCSYGTATVGNPLTFTATAGTVTFTPTGATLWMLTASAYTLPYTPPGTTMPASHATTTNGPWFSLPQYDDAPANTKTNRVWAALDGEPDGVELLPDGASTLLRKSHLPEISGENATHVLTDVANGVRYQSDTATPVLTLRKSNVLQVGAKYRIVIKVSSWTSGSVKTDNIGSVTLASGTGTFVVEGIATHALFSVVRNTTNVDLVIESISIQRIQPKPMTLAWRGVMGVGSGDLVDRSYPIVSEKADDVSTVLRFSRAVGVYGAVSRDGVTNAVIEGMTWVRGDTVFRFVAVDDAVTKFRVGYYILGVSAVITWGSWATFDGSFNPSTIYKLMLGYNNTLPLWHDTIAIWNKQVDDATLLKEMLK